MKLLRYLGLGVLIYIAAGLLLNAFIHAFLYQPPNPSYTAEEPDLLWLETSGNKKIAALWLPNPDAQCAILYSHGNAVDLGYIRPILEHVHELGFNVLAFDYQGYGISPGISTEKNTYADIQAAYDYLTLTENIPPNDIVLFGVSLGTGPTLELATKIEPPAAVILQTPYLSVYRRAVGIPLFPFDRYNNIQKIERITSPVLVVHGSGDFVIPMRHGKNIFDAANEPKNALWVPNAGHNDLFPVSLGAYDKAILSITASCHDASSTTQ